MKLSSQKPKNSKKKLIIVAVVAALILTAGLLAYYFLYAKNQQPDGSDGRITSDQVENSTENGTTAGDSDDNKTITPTPSTETPAAQDIEKATITRAAVSGSDLRVSAIFSQPTTGTCTLTLEKAGQTPITRTVNVVVGATYYACDGFRIPVSDFPEGGEWTLSVTHTINNNSAQTDKQTVSI